MCLGSGHDYRSACWAFAGLMVLVTLIMTLFCERTMDTGSAVRLSRRSGWAIGLESGGQTAQLRLQPMEIDRVQNPVGPYSRSASPMR
jgi:hypothetical protein